jgi:hypothetical protein
MSTIFSAFVHHDFQGACKALFCHRHTIIKPPSKPQARYIRVRKTKTKQSSVYQVAGTRKDRHRRTVERYKLVGDGHVNKSARHLNEWIIVRKQVSHEEKKSARLKKEKSAKEHTSEESKQRKKLAQEHKLKKSDHTLTPFSKGPTGRTRHSKSLQHIQNAKNASALMGGGNSSEELQLVEPKRHYKASRNTGKDGGPDKSMSKEPAANYATGATESDLSVPKLLLSRAKPNHNASTGRQTANIVEKNIAEDEMLGVENVDTRLAARQTPSSPFQQPDMTIRQSQHLVFGTNTRASGNSRSSFNDDPEEQHDVEGTGENAELLERGIGRYSISEHEWPSLSMAVDD